MMHVTLEKDITFYLIYDRLVYPPSLQSYNGFTITTPAPVLSILNFFSSC